MNIGIRWKCHVSTVIPYWNTEKKSIMSLPKIVPYIFRSYYRFIQCNMFDKILKKDLLSASFTSNFQPETALDVKYPINPSTRNRKQIHKNKNKMYITVRSIYFSFHSKFKIWFTRTRGINVTYIINVPTYLIFICTHMFCNLSLCSLFFHDFDLILKW